MNKNKCYIELTKPRINAWSCDNGARFLFSRKSFKHLDILLWTLLGSALSLWGSSGLKSIFERDADALMKRTQQSSLPERIFSR